MSRMLPDPELTIEVQPEVILLSMCLWGEARGETRECKIAIGNVIRNRVISGKAYLGGPSFRQVILAPMQFSCFNKYDPNREKLLHPLDHDSGSVWDSCYEVAGGILKDLPTFQDKTLRATHYYSPRAMRPFGSVPTWVASFIPTIEIAGTKFYRDPNAFVVKTIILHDSVKE